MGLQAKRAPHILLKQGIGKRKIKSKAEEEGKKGKKGRKKERKKEGRKERKEERTPSVDRARKCSVYPL